MIYILEQRVRPDGFDIVRRLLVQKVSDTKKLQAGQRLEEWL